MAGSAYAVPALAFAPTIFYRKAQALTAPVAAMPLARAVEPQEATSTPQAIADTTPCFCVLWLREKRGLDIHGDAGTIEANVKLADLTIGDVLLLSYAGIEHAAEVIDYSAAGNPVVIEANYKHCQVTAREIDLSRETVRGVYRPVH
jgi:hypothetical protein